MKPHFEQLFKPNVPLAHYTTFRIGGPALAFHTATTADECVDAVHAAADAGIPWYVIGTGSNILAGDDPLEMAVVAFTGGPPPRLADGGAVTVSGSTALNDLVSFCAARGLEGLENLAGIPGTVGGAIAGNAGAYGTCIADSLRSVRMLASDGSTKDVEGSDLEFDYRWSRIKRTGEVVLEARFVLSSGDSETLEGEIDRVIADRRGKHPDYTTHATAGSFFKNLPPPPGETRRKAAGALLEQVGAKDLRVGDAGTWHDHANIVVNYGKATSRDVQDLASEMARRVYDRFGIVLEPEVRYLFNPTMYNAPSS
jgi:UDP-N-acetylmuramate dehydrogenase